MGGGWFSKVSSHDFHGFRGSRGLLKIQESVGQELRPEGRNRRDETRLRGPEVLGPLRGLGIRPLVSAIRVLGNPFPEAP